MVFHVMVAYLTWMYAGIRLGYPPRLLKLRQLGTL